MITRKQLHFAMCETNARSMMHTIDKYIDISMCEVDEMLAKGVKGKYLKYVAYELGLRRYYPEGWKPVLKGAQPVKTKKKIPKDRNVSNTVTGKKHGNYKNGKNSIGSKNYNYSPKKPHPMTNYNDSIKSNKQRILIHNTSRVKEIIHMFGGARPLAIIANTSVKDVNSWPLLTGKHTMGFIPSAYIQRIQKFARNYGLNINRDDLQRLLP